MFIMNEPMEPCVSDSLLGKPENGKETIKASDKLNFAWDCL